MAGAFFTVSKNGCESGTALVNKSGSVSLEIAAGMYKIVGSASSAAKISRLTFVENNYDNHCCGFSYHSKRKR